MTKVIRKYKTWLIAIFGVFLMLTFLFSGPTNPLMPDPKKRVEGTLDGKKLRAEQLANDYNELLDLKASVPGVVAQLGIEEPLHWHMLSSEAQKMGLVGTADDGIAYLPKLAEMQLPGLVYAQLAEQIKGAPDNMIRQFAQQQLERMPAEQRAQTIKQIADAIESRLPAANTANRAKADMALAKLRGVERMMSGYANAGRISDKRLISIASSRLGVTLADVALVKSTQFADDSLIFTDEQIAAQWEKYKSVPSGVATAENPMGFGYVQSPRVKFEFITLERVAIENSIKLDPIDINKQWQLNRAKYTGDFATERSRIELEMRQDRAKTIMLDAERAYQAAVRSSLRGVEIVEGVKKLPADWASKAPTMQALAQSIADGVKASAKMTITPPVVTSRTSNWTLVSRAMDTAGIGFATFSSGANEYQLENVLAGVYELSGSSLFGMQVGVPFEGVMTDSTGNAYFLLVTDVRKTGPADSLAEVREQVVTDLRQQAAYEKLAAKIEGYRAQVATEGLDATVKAINASMPAGRASLDSTVLRSQQFTKEQGGQLAEVTDPKPLRDAITTAGAQLGLNAASDANLATRAIAVAIPGNRLLVLGQVVGIDPLTVEKIRQLDNRVAQSLAASQLSDAIEAGNGPFSFENMKKRLNWKPEGEEKPKKTENKQAAK
jgi:hypothetical protein